jgi:hypothetical protein
MQGGGLALTARASSPMPRNSASARPLRLWYMGMSMLTPEEKQDLLSRVTREASRLELRDVYALEDEKARFEEFLRAGRRGTDQGRITGPWLAFVRRATAAGIRFRRARVVSEPITDYIRFEHAGTDLNIEAGEEVRWLPRRKAMGITIPATDFWLLDRDTVLVNYYSGDGRIVDQELTRDAVVSAFCAYSFEAIWAAAVPHDHYSAD